MECRTLSSRLTSREGSSKVMVSGVSELRYVSRGLTTPGHTPSAGHGENRVRGWRYFHGGGEAGRRSSPCHSSSCFLALRGDVLVGAVWARPLFPPTASLPPSSSSRTGLYLRVGGRCQWGKVDPLINGDYDIDNLFTNEDFSHVATV